MGLSGKYNFINIARYGSFPKKNCRNQMKKPFDWARFNTKPVRSGCSKELILAYAPSYLLKSGKKTQEIEHLYSGTAQRVKRGIEIGCMAVIDVENNSGFHLEAFQTPVPPKGKDRGESSVMYHLAVILNRTSEVESLGIKIGVFDGYFAKANFVNGITKNTNLEVISKFRPDANLRYLYNSPQHQNKSRPKLYEGNINTRLIDRRRIRFCFVIYEDTHVFSSMTYSISLKRIVHIIYIEHYGTNKYAEGHAILFSKDLTLDPEKIYLYYKQRFQIEFLFCDVKNITGLENCQARSVPKINFNINTSLTTLSLAKAIYYLPIPNEKRESFSMLDIKTFYCNQYITDLIFSKFALDRDAKKIVSFMTNS